MVYRRGYEKTRFILFFIKYLFRVLWKKMAWYLSFDDNKGFNGMWFINMYDEIIYVIVIKDLIFKV